MRDLSPKAYGFLLAIHQHSLNISAQTMMDHFKVGRRAALSGLKELRDNSYIRTSQQRIGNKIMTVSVLTEKANRAFFGIVPSQVVESHNVTADTCNEHISSTTSTTVISKNMVPTKSELKSETEEFEVIDMAGWGDIFASTSSGDDYAEEKKREKEKAKQQRTVAYESRKRELGGGRAGRRQTTPKSEWSVPDVCFEFADRIDQHFNIAPWKVTQSKFSGALGGARNRLGTNGEVEVAAMDLFFKQISISEYKDAEVLWRLFVSRLPGLIKGAVLSVTTDADVLMAEEAWDKAQRILRGEDV